MAALIKLRHMPTVQKSLWKHLIRNTRNISTSKRNSDTATTSVCKKDNEDNNWVSYGFDYESKEEDTVAHHGIFFFGVTVCLVFGGFTLAYSPDPLERDWSQREAYLELHRREKAGLPVIDPNFVNPAQIVLPSEEELCDVEIII